MKKILKYVFKLCEFILLFILVVGITAAITKNIYSEILIKNFKSKGVFQEELSNDKIKIYHIESNEEIPTYTIYNNKITPGNTGDIVISLDLMLDNAMVGSIISFFAGGHAGLVLDDYKDSQGSASPDYTLESTGFGDNTNSDIFNKNYWYEDYVCPFNEVIALRVKTTEEERNKIISKAMALVGEPYNYTFFFNTKNTSYCTDIIGKAYSEIDVNLNKDKLTTSVYDLLISDETYISYYSYKDNNGIKYIYYLV